MAVAAIVAVIGVAISTYMAVRNQQQVAAQAQSIADQKQEEKKAQILQATYDENQARRRNQLLIAKQNAIFAASGVDTTEGTPLFVAVDSAKQAEMDALNIRAAGGRQAATSQFEINIARFRKNVALGNIPYTIAEGAANAASSGYSAYNKANYTKRSSMVTEWSEQ